MIHKMVFRNAPRDMWLHVQHLTLTARGNIQITPSENPRVVHMYSLDLHAQTTWDRLQLLSGHKITTQIGFYDHCHFDWGKLKCVPFSSDGRFNCQRDQQLSFPRISQKYCLPTRSTLLEAICYNKAISLLLPSG